MVSICAKRPAVEEGASQRPNEEAAIGGRREEDETSRVCNYVVFFPIGVTRACDVNYGLRMRILVAEKKMFSLEFG